MADAQNLVFGDLTLDESGLSVSRDGKIIHFTRNERTLLLAFIRNPRRLLRRSWLLDAIDPSELDRSDRYIDYLVNRLRVKIGDNKKSPKFIATRWGEGYAWIASPSSRTPIDTFLAIGSSVEPRTPSLMSRTSALIGQLRDKIAAGLGAGHGIVVAPENSRFAPGDKMHYLLQLTFRPEDDGFTGAATLREMSSKRLVRAFRLRLDDGDGASWAGEAGRVSADVVNALQDVLAEASVGLGTPVDAPVDIRLHKASALLSASNPQWLAMGDQLAAARVSSPGDPDTALQWCMHLFSRLALASPFQRMPPEERYSIEGEIEGIVLDLLHHAEGSPLLMLTCAKLLYFINRGHLELVEDFTERAFSRTPNYALALPILGQLHYAHGRFDEAVRVYDRGIAMVEPGPAFQLHMRVLKSMAYLAAGDRAGLDAMRGDLFSGLDALCPPDLALAIRWTVADPSGPLPDDLARALAEVGPAGARGVIEYHYFTSVRHLTSEAARANSMRGLATHVTRAHGASAVPVFISRRVELPVAA